MGVSEYQIRLMDIIFKLQPNAYGVTIWEEYKNRFNKDTALGRIYSNLSVLERDGYVVSSMGEATKERGGRRKKYWQLTEDGTRERAKPRNKKGSALLPSFSPVPAS